MFKGILQVFLFDLDIDKKNIEFYEKNHFTYIKGD